MVTMWLKDWLFYITCSKCLRKDDHLCSYAIRQKRRRLDGSGTYTVYVMDE